MTAYLVRRARYHREFGVKGFLTAIHIQDVCVIRGFIPLTMTASISSTTFEINSTLERQETGHRCGFIETLTNATIMGFCGRCVLLTLGQLEDIW